MLAELHIRDLGVIGDLHLVLGPGMTAVTGETGAGKTLVVQALDLLVGGRADPSLVRAGAGEADVEARFVAGEDETVLRRVVPAIGRSRAYIDARMVPVIAVAEAGGRLVDLHGQHAHQALLSPGAQRALLDAFAGSDLRARAEARRNLADVEQAMAALGGDEHQRARELDLLRFQVDELEAAGVVDPGEDARLDAEEALLADAVRAREAAGVALEALAGDDGAGDALAAASRALAGRGALEAVAERLRAVAAELADVARDLRSAEERLVDDPERLDALRARRALLRELRRKYGDSLEEVIAFEGTARSRLADLERHSQRLGELQDRRRSVVGEVSLAEEALGRQRRSAAPRLAEAVTAHLHDLAMPAARFEVAVGDDPAGDGVVFLLAANPGERPLPLAKVASGGELARAMLALRLVVSASRAQPADMPSTMVFDEVDAGVGGRAALAVGRALAAVAAGPGSPQVLVVTHLPQVAAFADTQIAVTKQDRAGRAAVAAEVVTGEARLVELSRMLSGQPASAAARGHAEELLAVAARARGGAGRG